MKWAALALAAGIVLAGGEPALAEPMKVELADEWEELPGATKNEVDLLRQGDPIRGTDYGAQSYAHPKRAQLLLSWVSGVEPEGGEAPGALVRRAFDAVRARRVASSPTAGSTAEVSFEETVERGVAELQLVWRHLSNETRYRVRALAWATPGGGVQLARGECVFADDNDEAESLCREALASLEPAAPEGARGDLGELPEAAPPPEPEADAPPAAALLGDEAEGGEKEPSGGEAPSLEPPPEGLGDGEKLYQRSPEEDGGEGKGKYLVIAGGLLLLAAFYLTTRRRGGKGEERDAEGEEE